MLTLFVIGLVWLMYVYVGYLAALVVIAGRRQVRSQATNNYMPSISVLIAARNEEKDIGWKIAETLNWNYPTKKLEILIGSDASDDATDEIVLQYAKQGVKLVRLERRGGKARALNRLAAVASGEILFFTDANAHIEREAVALMVSHFAHPQVGCVTGDSRPIKDRESPALSRGAQAYWGYETLLKRLENRIGSVLVCDGAIFCMRAALFEQLCPDLANDLESPMRVGAAGYWIVHEPRALVFEHETASALEEFKRRRRMCAQGMLAMFRIPGTLRGLRGWQFVSHKFLRWLSLVPALMVLAASAMLAPYSVFFRLLLLVQGLFYAAAGAGFALSLRRLPVPRLLAIPFYVVLGLLGALVGVLESLFGRRFDIWEIPSLSRGGSDLEILRGPGA
jgi:biofilm PGA synthesis N-glycosyltransferase PgaC